MSTPTTPEPNTFKVGDYAYASWGYDQTNIDWYLVTKRTPKGQITLSPVFDERTVDFFMQGNSSPTNVPNPHEKILKRFVKPSYRAGDEIANLKPSYGIIRPWDGKPRRYSSYA